MRHTEEALTHSMREHVAKHPKRKEKKKEVSHFKVEPADGGYSVETHYKHEGKDYMYHEPEKSVHKSLHSVKKHMEDCCGEEDESGI